MADKQQFLIHKSGGAETAQTTSHIPPGKDFASFFPELPANADFTDKVLSSATGMATFSVSSLCLPPVETFPQKPGESKKTLLAIRDAGMSCVESFGGVFGIIHRNVFGFFPANQRHSTNQWIRHFHQQISGHLRDLIIIGSAAYPCLDYTKKDTIANALKALEHAMLLGPGSIVSLDAVTQNVSGDRYFDQKDIRNAILEYERGLKLNPSRADKANLYNSLGVSFGIINRHEKAKSVFQRAMETDLKNVMPVYNMGYVSRLEKSYENAASYLSRALTMAPHVFEPALQMGQLYLDTGKPEKALSFLGKAARLEPASNPVHRILGLCHSLLGDHEAAETAFRKAVKIAPHDAESLSRLGRLYERQNRNLDISVVFHQQSLAISPDNGEYHLELARTFKKLGRNDEAVTACRRAESLGVTASDLLHQLGEVPESL